MNFPRLVNIDLLKNPANWLIVYLMVAFAVLVMMLVGPVAGMKGEAS